MTVPCTHRALLKMEKRQWIRVVADNLLKDYQRKHDDKDDDDEDPPARPNQGKKAKRRITKESESSKKPSFTKQTPKGKTPTKGSKTAHDDNPPQDTSEHKPRKTLNLDWFKQKLKASTPILNENKRQYVLNGLKIENLSQDILLGPAFNLLKGTCSSSIELEYNFQEYRTFCLDYFFNNDLEYLKTSNPEVTYTTSIMKTKAARNKIKGIEDMVPTLWSTIKHVYDKDTKKGIKHWGERRKLWYRFQIRKFSKQNVYSTKAILGLKSKVTSLIYTLNNIEDMLLLDVQHKLFHLDGNVIVDFIVALRMFTRSLILKRRVEDLQLEPYTPSYDPPRIVYEDLNKQKRVLRADELYKFSDVTLKSVRDEIHYRVLEFHMDYKPEMPKRKWMTVDRKRSGLMIELIDKQLREREIIRNLE
ncbi:hypothetical protein Tco_0353350 [Tanacetum coccineum]